MHLLKNKLREVQQERIPLDYEKKQQGIFFFYLR